MASKVQEIFGFVATSNYSTDMVNCEDCISVCISCIALALDKADGTITLEKSNDGVNFATAATAVTVAANSTAYFAEDEVACARYYRATWAKGANAAGTIRVILFGKPNN
jgi:hypothetical protein